MLVEAWHMNDAWYKDGLWDHVTGKSPTPPYELKIFVRQSLTIPSCTTR
jgi:hypothetical protein